MNQNPARQDLEGSRTLGDYERLRQYAQKTARELGRANHPQHTLPESRQVTSQEQFGFLGMRTREVIRYERYDRPVGWRLWRQMTSEREIYRRDYSGRKMIEHLLEDYTSIWLDEAGQLLRIDTLWNMVFGSGSHPDPVESTETNRVASDSDLALVDLAYPPYWSHSYTARFKASDMVKETTRSPDRYARRAQKPGLYLSEQLTTLRKAAGTYTSRGR